MQIQIYFLHCQILPHGLRNSKLRINTNLGHEQLIVLGHLDTPKTQTQKIVMGKMSPS